MGYQTVSVQYNPIWYARMDDAPGSGTMAATTGANGTHSNGPTLQQAGALVGEPGSNFAAQYDGTNDYSSVALNLTAYTRITVSFWLYWTAFAANDKLAMEFNNGYYTNNGFLIDPNNTFSDNTKALVGIGGTVGNPQYANTFVRPSANAFHHWMVDFNRNGGTTPIFTLYIDGLLVSTTNVLNTGAVGANFGSDTLYLMCRGGSSLFCPANSLLDEVAIYDGTKWGVGGTPPLATAAATLANGGSSLSRFNNYQHFRSTLAVAGRGFV